MDINLTLLNGRLAVPPFIETNPEGADVARMLVMVRSEVLKRIDVVPVFMSDPPEALLGRNVGAGSRLYVSGALVRRCSMDTVSDDGRLEVNAISVSLQDG